MLNSYLSKGLKSAHNIGRHNRLYYKFLRKGLKSTHGKCQWEIGKWNNISGKLHLCKKGFHCSKEIYQAFSWVDGQILTQVKVRGKPIEIETKSAFPQMKIVRAWEWQKKDDLALAIYCVEIMLTRFEREYPNYKRPRQAIELAKKIIKNPTEKNRSLARIEIDKIWEPNGDMSRALSDSIDLIRIILRESSKESNHRIARMAVNLLFKGKISDEIASQIKNKEKLSWPRAKLNAKKEYPYLERLLTKWLDEYFKKEIKKRPTIKSRG